MRPIAVMALALGCCIGHAQETPPPIIDMHLHAPRISDFEAIAGPAPIPHCVPMTDYPVPESGSHWSEVFRFRDLPCQATLSPLTDDEVMNETLAIMNARNVFGEVTAQYAGMPADDPSLEPYWHLLTELDEPVGIHIGTGPLGAPYLGFAQYRARLHSPLLLEEVLLRHPALRIYIMHAGWPMLDDLLAVLWTHPQVYVDVGVIGWAQPRREFHRYLRRIVEAGFLSEGQKRDIFYNNAARFLRLSDEEIALHHGR